MLLTPDGTVGDTATPKSSDVEEPAGNEATVRVNTFAPTGFQLGQPAMQTLCGLRVSHHEVLCLPVYPCWLYRSCKRAPIRVVVVVTPSLLLDTVLWRSVNHGHSTGRVVGRIDVGTLLPSSPICAVWSRFPRQPGTAAFTCHDDREESAGANGQCAHRLIVLAARKRPAVAHVRSVGWMVSVMRTLSAPWLPMFRVKDGIGNLVTALTGTPASDLVSVRSGAAVRLSMSTDVLSPELASGPFAPSSLMVNGIGQEDDCPPGCCWGC